jgi:hypothetical protein
LRAVLNAQLPYPTRATFLFFISHNSALTIRLFLIQFTVVSIFPYTPLFEGYKYYSKSTSLNSLACVLIYGSFSSNKSPYIFLIILSSKSFSLPITPLTLPKFSFYTRFLICAINYLDSSFV